MFPKRLAIVLLIVVACGLTVWATLDSAKRSYRSRAVAAATPQSAEVQQRMATMTAGQARASAEAIAKQRVVDRDEYADTVERNLLSKGIDAHVKAIGKEHETLRISWAAMSRPVVYNMMNSQGMNTDAPALGFKKVILTDDGSFSGTAVETWTYRWNGVRWD